MYICVCTLYRMRMWIALTPASTGWRTFGDQTDALPWRSWWRKRLRLLSLCGQHTLLTTNLTSGIIYMYMYPVMVVVVLIWVKPYLQTNWRRGGECLTRRWGWRRGGGWHCFAWWGVRWWWLKPYTSMVHVCTQCYYCLPLFVQWMYSKSLMSHSMQGSAGVISLLALSATVIPSLLTQPRTAGVHSPHSTKDCWHRLSSSS